MNIGGEKGFTDTVRRRTDFNVEVKAIISARDVRQHVAWWQTISNKILDHCSTELRLMHGARWRGADISDDHDKVATPLPAEQVHRAGRGSRAIRSQAGSVMAGSLYRIGTAGAFDPRHAGAVADLLTLLFWPVRAPAPMALPLRCPPRRSVCWIEVEQEMIRLGGPHDHHRGALRRLRAQERALNEFHP